MFTGTDRPSHSRHASQFPTSWAAIVQQRLLALADQFMMWQTQSAYRHIWYPPNHGYYMLMGHGNNQYRPSKFLTTAWRRTQYKKY
ncbi:MAG: hypothetical protein AAGJ35_04905 [Myxococcota bacterium]